MADEANTQEVEQTSTAETTAAESQTVEQTTTTETQDGNQEAAKATETASTGDKSTSQTQDVKVEHKPASRRSAAFRIQQLNNKVNELKAAQKPQQQDATDEWGNQIEPTEDTPDPKYAALESKISQLEGLVKPVMTNTQKAEDDGELSSLFSGEKASERSKYEDRIRQAWNSDETKQYKDLAASDLYKIFDYDAAIERAKAQAIEEYKKADKEAREASASGSSNTSNRTGGAAKSIMDMSDEEFRAHNERIKAGVTGA